MSEIRKRRAYEQHLFNDTSLLRALETPGKLMTLFRCGSKTEFRIANVFLQTWLMAPRKGQKAGRSLERG